MKIYHFKRTQNLPITVQEAWTFFSSPKNLLKITPDNLRFEIIENSGDGKIYQGQFIRYKVVPFPGFRVQWLTEITHVAEPECFVDEQRTGPFALWHHRHTFREIPGGIEMTDEVRYAVPLGILGRFVNRLFVERRVFAIFDYRYRLLQQYFPEKKQTMEKNTVR